MKLSKFKVTIFLFKYPSIQIFNFIIFISRNLQFEHHIFTRNHFKLKILNEQRLLIEIK